MKITWKTIPNFPNYQVNQLGYVRNIKTNTLFHHKNTIQLSNCGKIKNIKITRLVAEMFIPLPNFLINIPKHKIIVALKHKNSLSVDNLYWTTRGEFEKLMYKQKRKSNGFIGRINERHHSSKTIYQFDKHGNYIKTWPNSEEIYRQLGYNRGNICSCCRGELMTSKGFIWSRNRYL